MFLKICKLTIIMNLSVHMSVIIKWCDDFIYKVKCDVVMIDDKHASIRLLLHENIIIRHQCCYSSMYINCACHNVIIIASE